MSPENNSITTAIVLALLLTGCGGGGGGSTRAIAGSPSAPGTQGTTPGIAGSGSGSSTAGSGSATTPGTDTQSGNSTMTGSSTGGTSGTGSPPGSTAGSGTNSSTGNAGSSSSSNSSGTGSDNDAGSNTTPRQQGEPTRTPAGTMMAQGWISGDVLATMLAQQTNFVLENGTQRQIISQYAAQPWSSAEPGGQRLWNSSNAPVVGYQTLTPVERTPGRYHYITSTFWRYNTARPTFDFNELVELVDITVGLPDYTAGNHEVGFDRLGEVAANTELLTVHESVEARITLESQSTGRADQDTRLTLRSTFPLSIRQGAAVPYNRVLQEWRATGSEHFVQLLLLKGADIRQARLCFNTHVPGIKRLSCTLWTAPAGWTLGQRLSYQGIYVVDDRSTTGKTGLEYWQTP